MKKYRLFSLLCLLVIGTSSFSQENRISFTVSVSPDSILMDNYFEVLFSLENADGKNFTAPDFIESFDVMSGPNYANSISMLNGEKSQIMTVTYFLQPRDVGVYYIAPASIEANGEILETNPLEIFVHPNPDGVRKAPPMNNGIFDLNFDDAFDQDSLFGEWFQGFDRQIFPFGFGELPDSLGRGNQLGDFNEFFKFFNEAIDEDEFNRMLEQMQQQLKGFDFDFPEPPAPENDIAPKKKRKTTRI